MTGFVRDLTELRKTDVGEAGGKGANLGELTAAGLPVPGGFVITAGGYLHSMDAAGVRPELCELLNAGLAAAGDPQRLAEVCDALQTVVRKAGVAPDVQAELLDAYQGLGSGRSSRCGRRPPPRTARTTPSPG